MLKAFKKPLVYLLLSSTSLCAESLTVLGLRIPIEKIESADDKSVVVQVPGSQSRLIDKSALEEYVVTEALRPEIVKNASHQELIGFIEGAIKNQKPNWVAHGIAVLCQSSQESSPKSIILSDALKSFASKDSIETLLKILPKADFLDESCAAPIFTSASNLGVMPSVTYLYKFSSSIKSQLRQGYIDSLIQGEEEKANSNLNQLNMFYGESDSDVSSLKKAAEAVISAKNLLKDKRTTEINSRVKIINEAGFQGAWSAILEKECKSAIENGDAEGAIYILSLISSPKESSSELLISALKVLSKDHISIFSNEGIKRFILGVLDSTPSVRSELASILEPIFLDSLQSGQLLGSSDLLEILSLAESSQIEGHIFSAALHQAREGNMQKADVLFSLLKRPLTFKERLKLFILTRGWLLSIVIGGLSISLMFSFLIRTYKPKEKKIADAPKSEEEFERPRFVTSQTWGRIQIGDPEYRDLLNFFNLSIDATEKDIKNAFRKKIKEVHPDVNNNSSDEKLFIQTKENYERLLALLEARAARRE